MESKDFLLLVVASAKDKPLTPVQLQKSLFLIQHAKLPESPDPLYTFEPYHYGPFDIDIYRDADLLQEQGLVARVPSDSGTWIDTAITPNGSEEASLLMQRLSEASVKYIEAIVGWVQSQSFGDLVRAIYKGFPEYRENSVFQA